MPRAFTPSTQPTSSVQPTPSAKRTRLVKRTRQKWYHVRIALKGEEPLVGFNLSESNLKRAITIPYNQGNRIVFNSRLILPQNIASIQIIVTSRNESVDRFERLRGKDVTSEFITAPPEVPSEQKAKNVFIVHGHDNASKNELSSFLFRLGLKPIVLHEQANTGKTVIEKFEQYASDVGYAFILLTPDDIVGKGKKGLKARARQNVILELGYFMGKLGRDKVCGLYKGGVELPSDVLGILYLKYEKSIQERAFDISQELTHAGYDVSLVT
jgi:predicted nucleotide-binding protein